MPNILDLTRCASRFTIPEEDFEISMKAYEAPRRMVEVMKQAATKANSEHKEYESQVGGLACHGSLRLSSLR